MNPPLSAEQPRSPRLLFTLLLTVVTLAVFWPALSGDFVYDDLLLVEGNTLIQSFGNLGEAFARPYWEGLDPDGSETVGLWRPLTSVALMVGHLLGSGSPFGFHLVSLLAHLAVVLCAAKLASRLAQSSVIGLWTGLLFALHPVHVESIAWISSVSDPLSALFCLLALGTHWTWLQGSRDKFPWFTGLWFFLGLISKESALATLPMMLALDLFRFKKGGEVGQRLRGYFPAISAFFMYTLIRMAVFGDISAGLLTVTTDFNVPASRLAWLRVELLGGYLQLLTWPADLNLFRPFTPEFAAGDTTLLVASIWSAICLAVAAVLLKQKRRVGAVAWILIPASLLPMLVRISALGLFPLSDRYLYLAVFGFTLSLALLVWKKLPTPIATAVLGCIAALYGWQSFNRTADWSSESTLFARSAEQSPRSPFVAWLHGRSFLSQYKQTRAVSDLSYARQEYERGMELLASAARRDTSLFATKRDHLEMNLGLAWCYLFQGELDAYRDFDTPKKIFQDTVNAYPESSNARVGLGIALMMAAEDLDGQAKSAAYQDSGESLRAALKLSESDEAHCAMGQLLLRLGDSQRAAREFEKALALRPEHLAYMMYLVQALEFDDEDARIHQLLKQATALYPDAAEPIRMQGSLAVRQDRLEDAVRWFGQSIAKDPNDGYAHLQLGIVFGKLNQNKSALKFVLRACELAPGEFEAQYNAAVLILSSERPEKARDYLMRAYMLRPASTENGLGSVGDVLSREIRKLDPDDPEILWRLGEADRRLGLDESALEWVNRSIAINPNNGSALYTRAMLLAKDEETKAIAIADLEHASELVPENFDAHNELGHLLAEVGRHQEAINHLLEALKILPKTGLTGTDRALVSQAISHALATSQQSLEAGDN